MSRPAPSPTGRVRLRRGFTSVLLSGPTWYPIPLLPQMFAIYVVGLGLIDRLSTSPILSTAGLGSLTSVFLLLSIPAVGWHVEIVGNDLVTFMFSFRLTEIDLSGTRSVGMVTDFRSRSELRVVVLNDALVTACRLGRVGIRQEVWVPMARNLGGHRRSIERYWLGEIGRRTRRGVAAPTTQRRSIAQMRVK